jgi:prephenate dehydrogenase
MKDSKKTRVGGRGQGSETPAPSPKPPSPTPYTIAIIGGRGQMGRWFKRFFEGQGFKVLVADRKTRQTPPEVVRQAQVVVISVPIHQVEQVVREVAPHLQPEAALMDLTSVKQKPMAAMLAHFKGEVVGTHPLFGPGEKSLAGQTVVLCPGRGEKWFNWLKDLLVSAGARLKVTTAKEHDRLMAVVQGLAHFVLIALGATIRDLGIKPEDLEDFSTPTFATLHRLTRHLVSQDARLYACIQLANPANRIALRALEASVADLLYFIQRQNADGLVRLLEEIKQEYGGGG